jgi:hypothetical protein
VQLRLTLVGNEQLFVSPLALAIPVFTIDQQQVKLIPKRLVPFIGLAIFFHVFMIALHNVSYYQTECWEALMSMLGLGQPDAPRKPKLSEVLRRRRTPEYQVAVDDGEQIQHQ